MSIAPIDSVESLRKEIEFLERHHREQMRNWAAAVQHLQHLLAGWKRAAAAWKDRWESERCAWLSACGDKGPLQAVIKQLTAERDALQAAAQSERELGNQRAADLFDQYVLRKKTALAWKRSAKRHRLVLGTRWIETCVALKTAAITAERDALRQRVAELEQRGADPDPCDVTEPVPRQRVRPTSVPDGRMR